MADRQPKRDREPLADDGDSSNAGMPRWVKVFLMVGLALVLLFVLAQVTGLAGDHGPGRHGPGRHGAGSERQSYVLHEGGGHIPSGVHHS